MARTHQPQSTRTAVEPAPRLAAARHNTSKSMYLNSGYAVRTMCSSRSTCGEESGEITLRARVCGVWGEAEGRSRGCCLWARRVRAAGAAASMERVARRKTADRSKSRFASSSVSTARHVLCTSRRLLCAARYLSESSCGLKWISALKRAAPGPTCNRSRCRLQPDACRACPTLTLTLTLALALALTLTYPWR